VKTEPHAGRTSFTSRNPETPASGAPGRLAGNCKIEMNEVDNPRPSIFVELGAEPKQGPAPDGPSYRENA